MTTSVVDSTFDVAHLDRDQLRAFLKQYDAWKYWRALGITPKANGARPGSQLAAQRAINTLIDELYQRPVPLSAISAYSGLWSALADKLCNGAWSSPTPLELQPTSVTEFIDRILVSEPPVPRESVLDLLKLAPFKMESIPESLDALKPMEQIQALRSIDEMRGAIQAFERRLTEIEKMSRAEGEQIAHRFDEINEQLSEQSGRLARLRDDTAWENSQLSHSVERIADDRNSLLLRFETLERDVVAQRELCDDLRAKIMNASEVHSLPVPSEQREGLGTTTIQFKPTVRVIEPRENAEVKDGVAPQIQAIALALRNIGVAKQSAEQAASVIAAAFISSGWLNVTGSLSAFFAEKLCAALHTRVARVAVPVGCLEAIPKARKEWAGVTTTWHITGFDRAPAQVTTTYIRRSVVKKLLTKSSEHFAIAVHEGGRIGHDVLAGSCELGAWVDTDSLVWSLRERSSASEGLVNMRAFVVNPARGDIEADDAASGSALARIAQARYSAALTAIAKDSATYQQLLERSFIAPLYAAAAELDVHEFVRDEVAVGIASRLRTTA